MKKTISALSLLLFILIVTCAYQKSATIYADSLVKHPTPMDIIETDTLIVIKEPAHAIISPVKEKTVVTKTIEKQIEVKTAVENEEEAEKTLLAKLKSAVLKRLQSYDTKEEETEQSKSLLKTQKNQEVKNISPKVLQNRSEEESKPETLENASTVIENISLTVTYNTSEDEIVSHLVEALKQQDLAFKNRDKFMLEIEALIKRALDDRCAAIDYRKKEELALKKTQKVILEERDLNTKKIPEPYTINSGE